MVEMADRLEHVTLVLRRGMTHCEFDDFDDLLMPMDIFYGEYYSGEQIFMRKMLQCRAQLFAVLSTRKK